MTKYEFTVVYKADNEKEKSEAIKAVENLLKSKKANILNRKEWGLKTLAYQIKKQDKGFYVFYELEMDGSEIASIEREIALNNAVLRHLFVKEVYHKVKRRPFKAKPVTEDAEVANVEANDSANEGSAE